MTDDERIEQAPDAYLKAIGRIFAVFGEGTQDSGNVSYGVQVGPKRYFVKTAGRPDDPKPVLGHSGRVSLLRNAVVLSHGCSHRALPRLHQVIESPSGPLLFYRWVDGELVKKAIRRVRGLPASEVMGLLDVVYGLHHQLARSGWIAVDFYDGCMIYDFGRREVHLVDLDNYRNGPFTNEIGRMFGSTRFMAPEEFELGAPIDERTTVFTMGRTAAVLLSDSTLERGPFRGSDAQHEIIRRACRDDRSERFESMAEFHAAWMGARNTE